MTSLAQPIRRGIARVRNLWPGFLTTATVAMAAVFVSSQYGGPTLLYALLLGIAFNFLSHEARTSPGIEFSAKTILRVGVALLGARIGLEQIAALGWEVVALTVGMVLATLAVGRLLASALGLSRHQGILTGGAVGICGASAALAIATVLPRHAQAERDTLFTVVAVTSLGTLTMIFYPSLAAVAGLEREAAGVFLGGTIHDVAQVVGAGYMVSDTAGDTATVTKLLRVAMLVPVVVGVAALERRRGDPVDAQASLGSRLPLPPFLIAFAVIAALNSLGGLPTIVSEGATELSRWCLICAIASIGMKTEFRQLATVGWRAVALMMGETAFIAVIVLGFAVTRLA